jgi:hypothetical protein
MRPPSVPSMGRGGVGPRWRLGSATARRSKGRGQGELVGQWRHPGRGDRAAAGAGPQHRHHRVCAGRLCYCVDVAEERERTSMRLEWADERLPWEEVEMRQRGGPHWRVATRRMRASGWNRAFSYRFNRPTRVSRKSLTINLVNKIWTICIRNIPFDSHSKDVFNHIILWHIIYILFAKFMIQLFLNCVLVH